MKKFACILLLVTNCALADRHAAFQSLIHEPASLLDITMLRLEDFITWTKPNMALTYRIDSESEVRSIDINAYYQPDEQRIQVSVSLMDTQSTSSQMQAGCDGVLNAININLSKSLPGLFIHVDGSYPPGLSESNANLADLIELSCYVYGTSSANVRHSTRQALRMSRPTIPTGMRAKSWICSLSCASVFS
jgi:hypothetical protein